ncbi:hypothetical protein PROFUN_06579 [Planoprotostelium fungivorum]|uniref:Uncharacterized protein n=1 Tax=Planoprotostelium fungivorum TaxID=1890364 RepID=A0A2P6MRW9_9EUKA|nr:hypothetical protein PROFUN_06579 [Planoprotostelium fungivorum]
MLTVSNLSRLKIEETPLRAHLSLLQRHQRSYLLRNCNDTNLYDEQTTAMAINLKKFFGNQRSTSSNNVQAKHVDTQQQKPAGLRLRASQTFDPEEQLLRDSDGASCSEY